MLWIASLRGHVAHATWPNTQLKQPAVVVPLWANPSTMVGTAFTCPNFQSLICLVFDFLKSVPNLLARALPVNSLQIPFYEFSSTFPAWSPYLVVYGSGRISRAIASTSNWERMTLLRRRFDGWGNWWLFLVIWYSNQFFWDFLCF